MVRLKETVNDPQGLVVQEGLHALGHPGVLSARVGKFISLELEGEDEEVVREEVEEMCRQLLCNGVVEDYQFKLRRSEVR
ncbi:MAG: phosphoribosylformylglycinamidine synthase subunit PurS [Candidatus Dormibacteria bacterium]